MRLTNWKILPMKAVYEMTGIKRRMVEDLEKPPSVWLEYSYDKKIVADGWYFAFYEGEDRKFYNDRIKQYLSPDFNTYHCGSRENVLDIYKKINEHSEKRELYFIDKDYNLKRNDNSDIYETERYSIENYYTDTHVLKEILKNEMGMNISSKDYEEVIKRYEKLHGDFIAEIKDFNILGAACIYSGISIELNKFNLEKNICISIDKIETKIDLKFESLIEHYQNKLEEDVRRGKKNARSNFDSFTKNKMRIIKFYEEYGEIISEEIENFTRGKNDLWFLKQFIELLKQINKQGKFSKKYQSFYLEVSKNQLSSLGGYVETPKQLIDYLQSFA